MKPAGSATSISVQQQNRPHCRTALAWPKPTNKLTLPVLPWFETDFCCRRLRLSYRLVARIIEQLPLPNGQTDDTNHVQSRYDQNSENDYTGRGYLLRQHENFLA